MLEKIIILYKMLKNKLRNVMIVINFFHENTFFELGRRNFFQKI